MINNLFAVAQEYNTKKTRLRARACFSSFLFLSLFVCFHRLDELKSNTEMDVIIHSLPVLPSHSFDKRRQCKWCCYRHAHPKRWQKVIYESNNFCCFRLINWQPIQWKFVFQLSLLYINTFIFASNWPLESTIMLFSLIRQPEIAVGKEKWNS